MCNYLSTVTPVTHTHNKPQNHDSTKSQMQLARIQKERDQFSDELETLKERSESSNTLLMKAARDREAMQTDLEVLKERYEKSHAIQQKLQVIPPL